MALVSERRSEHRLDLTTYMSDPIAIEIEFVSTGTGDLGQSITLSPEELSEVEIEDVEESRRAITEGKAKRFKSTQEAVIWLDQAD